MVSLLRPAHSNFSNNSLATLPLQKGDLSFAVSIIKFPIKLEQWLMVEIMGHQKLKLRGG